MGFYLNLRNWLWSLYYIYNLRKILFFLKEKVGLFFVGRFVKFCIWNVNIFVLGFVVFL